MKKIHAVILAGGRGERLGNELPKQFLKISGKTIIEHTIDVFEKHHMIDTITVVINKDYRYLMEQIIRKGNYTKLTHLLNGGHNRQQSSYIGIQHLKNEDIVLIHDAVRPFLDERIIYDCINELKKYNAVDVVIPSADTLVEIHNELLKSIPDRSLLFRGQTPQGFKVGTLKKAHENAIKDGYYGATDDCTLVNKYNLSKIKAVKGDEKNIKVTYKEDLYLADRLFQLKSYKLFEDIDLNKLSNKVLVIFGGSSGIGESIVNLARKYGAIVYSFSRRNDVDISIYTQVSYALNKVNQNEGKIDYVINTAAVLNIGSLKSRNIDSITNEINVNYIGSINVVKSSLEYLQHSKGSILLFTSSSYTRGRPLYSIYSSSKAAIVNLVQAVHEEYTEWETRINVINPERTDTPMRRGNFGKEPKETLLDPMDVAEKSLKSLLSNISGQVIDVKLSD